MFPGASLLSTGVLSACCICSMVYMFIGWLVLQERMVAAIERIAAQKAIIIKRDRNHNQIELPMELWNPSVATVTLIALSVNTPLIFLNVIDLLLDTSGEINTN